MNKLRKFVGDVAFNLLTIRVAEILLRKFAGWLRARRSV